MYRDLGNFYIVIAIMYMVGLPVCKRAGVFFRCYRVFEVCFKIVRVAHG